MLSNCQFNKLASNKRKVSPLSSPASGRAYTYAYPCRFSQMLTIYKILYMFQRFGRQLGLPLSKSPAVVNCRRRSLALLVRRSTYDGRYFSAAFQLSHDLIGQLVNWRQETI